MDPNMEHVTIFGPSDNVIDVAEADLEQDPVLCPYHGGNNQVFKIENAGEDQFEIISLLDDVSRLGSAGDTLAFKNLEDEDENCPSFYQLWKIKDKQLTLNVRGGDLYLSVDERGKLTLAKNKGCEWTIKEAKALSRPATSCHFTYKPKNSQTEKPSRSWELECSVTVESSHDCTYFCAIGWWGPGGYCGIQQLPGGIHKAIYSMWNSSKDKVTCVKSGKNVVVTSFGGEGTGLKSMRDFDWKVGEAVNFRIEGRSDGGCAWTCACYIEEELMAIYRRECNALFNPESGFYSFVEDWNRVEGAEGHKVKRKARYFNQKMTIDGKELLLDDNPGFTKVLSHADKYACHKAKCFKNCDDEWGLETGGPD